MKKLGIRPERLQLEWISAAEGARFAEIMRKLEEMRQKVTPEEIEHTKKVLKEQRAKKKGEQKDKVVEPYI
jgi:heterodisulfide reductase subunit A